jgi:hypothetical protein
VYAQDGTAGICAFGSLNPDFWLWISVVCLNVFHTLLRVDLHLASTLSFNSAPYVSRLFILGLKPVRL